MSQSKKTLNVQSEQLIDGRGLRKYINLEERERYYNTTMDQVEEEKLFSLLLLLTGVRISEALNVRRENFDFSNESIHIETLKKRKKGIWREIPLPEWYLQSIKQFMESQKLEPKNRLWNWSRSTASRRIKKILKEANIIGIQACPKGLRHGFGVQCILVDVPLNLVKKWMGHSSLKVTMIYLNVIGKEERRFARKLWTKYS